MLQFIIDFLEKKRQQRLILENEFQRNKENFVYRYLLKNHEARLRGTVDFGAWWYASRDMARIKKLGKLNEAYTFYMKVMKKEWEKEKCK